MTRRALILAILFLPAASSAQPAATWGVTAWGGAW